MDLLYRGTEVHISSVFFQGPGPDGDGRNLRVVSAVKQTPQCVNQYRQQDLNSGIKYSVSFIQLKQDNTLDDCLLPLKIIICNVYLKEKILLTYCSCLFIRLHFIQLLACYSSPSSPGVCSERLERGLEVLPAGWLASLTHRHL